MKLKKILLGAAALLSLCSSCLALETGYYYKLDGDNLFAIDVIAHEGYLKGQNSTTRYEFISLRNSVNETYSSQLIKTGNKTYATTAGLVTNDNDEQGRQISGHLKGLRVGYERMGQKEGDFTIEDLGNNKLRVSSNVGYVKGFAFDGIYTREETFVAASPTMALYALETIGKKTGYLAVGEIDYTFRVMNKSNGSGYSIMALQEGAAPAMFDVDVALYDISFIWNNQPLHLFQDKEWSSR